MESSVSTGSSIEYTVWFIQWTSKNPVCIVTQWDVLNTIFIIYTASCIEYSVYSYKVSCIRCACSCVILVKEALSLQFRLVVTCDWDPEFLISWDKEYPTGSLQGPWAELCWLKRLLAHQGGILICGDLSENSNEAQGGQRGLGSACESFHCRLSHFLFFRC